MLAKCVNLLPYSPLALVVMVLSQVVEVATYFGSITTRLELGCHDKFSVCKSRVFLPVRTGKKHSGFLPWSCSSFLERSASKIALEDVGSLSVSFEIFLRFTFVFCFFSLSRCDSLCSMAYSQPRRDSRRLLASVIKNLTVRKSQFGCETNATSKYFFPPFKFAANQSHQRRCC